MNRIQRALAKAILGIDIKTSAAGPAIVATHQGTPIWPTRDYAHFAKEGYLENAIAFRCIQLIAQSAAAIKLGIADGGKKLDQPDHPILDLMNHPSPNATGSELIEAIFSYVKIAGNAYIEGVTPSRAGATPKELYSLRPDRMKVIPGRGGLAMQYQYDVNGTSIKWDVDPVTGAGPILHLKAFHPTDDWYGLSAMQPAAYSIDQHNEASKHNFAVLQNGAVPSGALTFVPIAHEGQIMMAPQTVVDEAEKKLIERHGGARNSGKPMVTNGKVEWVEFSQNMEELQLNESKLETARDICTSFGVPHILIIPGQSTYNNNREAKLALYEETVLPLFDWLLDHLNVWLTPQFGSDKLRLIADLDELDALSPRRDEKRKSYLELFDKKLLKRNEVREGLNYDEITDRPDFDPQNFEVTAVTALMSASKLSNETGWKVLAKWGILPEELGTDQGAKDEQERLDAQSEAAMSGMLGLEVDPVTGEPIDPTQTTPPGGPKPPEQLPAPAKKPSAVPAPRPKPRVVA